MVKKNSRPAGRKMDIRDHKDIYANEVTDLLEKLDLNDPEKSVVKTHDSLTAMLEHFITRNLHNIDFARSDKNDYK